MKAVPQVILFVAAFFATWAFVNRIDLVGLFRVEEFSRENEAKLGELIVESLTSGHREIGDTAVTDLMNTVLARLCDANGIGDTPVRLHIIKNGDVNAFALPDRRLILNSGLIDYCRTPGEVAGVIAHEMAHIEHRHVMKKLVKEVGMAMLMAIAGGQSGGDIVKQTARTLSSTAFDRDLETDADTTAVGYMARAGIDPGELANFLYRLSQEKHDMPKAFEWISTHPNSADRAVEILKLKSGRRFDPRPIADSLAWKSYRTRVREAARETGITD